MKMSNGYDEISLARERNSRDKFKNEYGENLTELCSTTNLRVLNGRPLGDLYGEYCGIHGLSTIDYILASENVLKDNQIQYMRVQPITFLSDHRPLLLKLSHHSTHAIPKEGAIPLQNMPEKMIINDMILFKNEIAIVLCEEKQKEMLTEILL